MPKERLIKVCSLAAVQLLFSWTSFSATIDEMLVELQKYKKGLEKSLAESQRNLALLAPTIISNDLQRLESTQWIGGDYRDLHDVTENVWEGSWTTIFGKVEEGQLGGVLIRGYILGTFLSRRDGEGKFLLRQPPSGLSKGEYVLLRAKFPVGGSKESIPEAEFGYTVRPPAGTKQSTIENPNFRKEEAIRAMKLLLVKAKEEFNKTMEADREERQVAIEKQQRLADEKRQIQERQQVAEQRKINAADKNLKILFEHAEKGYAYAQYEIGRRYLKGDGVNQDEKLGKQWLEKSAAQGNISAKYLLEQMAKEGKQ